MATTDKSLFTQAEIFRLLGYRPSVGQSAFHKSTAKRKCLVAAARFGKSIAAAYDTLADLMTPGRRVWIVAPQFALGEFEFRYVVDAIARLLGGLSPANGVRRFQFSVNSGNMAIETMWDSFVRVKSAAHPQSLLGEELDYALMVEGSQVPGHIFDVYIQARLAMREGRACVPTTPAARGFNAWVKDWWERGKSGHPAYASFGPFAAIDNPLYSLDSFKLAYETTPWDIFREQYLGHFVLPSGRVYSEADPDVVGVPDEFVAKLSGVSDWRNFPVWGGVDFGGTDPFVALVVAQLPDGVWYVADEHYCKPGADLRLQQHSERIAAKLRGLHVRSVFTDHDRADQHEIQRELQRHGINVRNARKGNGKDGLLPTIDEMRSLFWQGKLFINRERCPNTMRELLEYRWEESRSGEEMNNKPLPRDWQNHCMDAMRYAICSALKMSGRAVEPGRASYGDEIETARAKVISALEPSAERNILDLL